MDDLPATTVATACVAATLARSFRQRPRWFPRLRKLGISPCSPANWHAKFLWIGKGARGRSLLLIRSHGKKKKFEPAFLPYAAGRSNRRVCCSIRARLAFLTVSPIRAVLLDATSPGTRVLSFLVIWRLWSGRDQSTTMEQLTMPSFRDSTIVTGGGPATSAAGTTK